MTGFEPHPIYRLPTQAECDRMTQTLGWKAAGEWHEALIAERARQIKLEQEDPLHYGYRPPIWYVADELLEEGKEVVLVDPDWDIYDPDLIRRRPPDFLLEAARRRVLGLPKLVILGQRELWIAGSNRSGKTEYAARKIVEIGRDKAHARTWSWSDSEEKSRAKQHPVVYRYIPQQWKRLLNEKGKYTTAEAKMGYGTNGFIGNKLAAPNAWQHWFNNYKQDLRDVEGDQLDASWHDEERDPDRIKTVRVRLGDRRGRLMVTFTPIDATFTAIVSEYETDKTVILEVDAEWLPKEKPNGLTPYEKREGVEYEKVRRVAIAGPGSDGDQKANILYFHIGDNAYYGYDPNYQHKPGTDWPIYGKRAFYLNQNIVAATRTKILTRCYGILVRGALQQFNFNSAVHTIEPWRIPTVGTRYHIVDPCPGRNWFMIWLLIDPKGRWFIYREWPSYGGNWRTAYIPGIGDPEAWSLPGARKPNSDKTVYDGVKGPAQTPFRFGLNRYKEEIARVEGEVVTAAQEATWKAAYQESWIKTAYRRQRHYVDTPMEATLSAAELEAAWQKALAQREEIYERWLDSRWAGAPVQGKEVAHTMLDELDEIGLEFRAAPSEQNILTREDGSIEKINDMLDYDPPDVCPLGKYSERLSRINEPRLFVSTECPNVKFALGEWTGQDGQHGACKDPADCVRYAALCDLEHVGEGAFTWKGPRIR